MRVVDRRAFLGMAAGMGLASCARMNPKKLIGDDGGTPALVIAAIGDSHITDAASASLLNVAVSSINANREVDLSIVLGDMANDGTLNQLTLAKMALDRLEKPYYVLPGNHDLEPGVGKPYANFNAVFNWKNWDHESHGWLLLGIDSNEGDGIDVSILPDQIEWLQSKLGGAGQRPIALFTHHPFNPNSAQYRVVNADEVLGIFAGHDLRLVAAGHYHGNQVEERDGVTFTTTAACSTQTENFDGTTAKGYRLIRAEAGVVTTEFVELSS